MKDGRLLNRPAGYNHSLRAELGEATRVDQREPMICELNCVFVICGDAVPGPKEKCCQYEKLVDHWLTRYRRITHSIDLFQLTAGKDANVRFGSISAAECITGRAAAFGLFC